MQKFNVELTLDEAMLGTVPKDKDIYTTFIASKAPTPENGEEEVETVEEIEDKGWTGFHSIDGKPFIYDYMIKGFFKDACGMLSRVSGKKIKGTERVPKNLSSKLTAYKKVIDGLIFVKPRKIFIELSGDMGILERPLRVQTPQGERVCLARSDTVPAGSKLKFDVIVLGGVDEDTLREWFDYGALRGLGQWRNGGYGSFTYTMK